jgi:hypothetical protein
MNKNSKNKIALNLMLVPPLLRVFFNYYIYNIMELIYNISLFITSYGVRVHLQKNKIF